MNALTAEPNLADFLRQAKAITEIRDSEGKYLGMFTPGDPREVRLYLQAWFTTNPAELERRKNTPHQVFTTDEVLKHLESLEQK
jgi:hypothetical protein